MPKKILIACSHFWPSIGGLETSMGQLGGELAAAGYAVSVMTLAFPGRSADSHGGVAIISVDMPAFQHAIRAAVASGVYDCCLLIQDPLGNIVWSVEQLAPPAHTRVLVQPIINEDGYARWKDNQDFRQRLAAILKSSTAALTMTKSGPDHRFMREAGVEPVYLPNASSQAVPAGDFRQQLGIPADRFVILHVANLYWVKNHVGLIDALAGMPDNWQLVMIGTPTGATDCVEAVQAKLASRPEIKYIPGLPPEWVSAAMRAADVVVLASHGEGSPITLLEAMSHGKPWLATPQCGAANDHLGGFITDLPGFMPRLRQLAAQPALRKELGEVSHAHWSECYAWPVVLRGWMDLIETGRLQRSFEPGAALVERMRQVRAALADADAATPAGHARGALLAEFARRVDFAAFHVDAYREGPVRFGWVGTVPKRTDEVNSLLIPAMGSRHQMAILDEQAGPAEAAAFFQSIDVLLLTSEQDYALAAAAAAMACGVYLLGVRQGRLAELLEQQPGAQLAAPSGAALHEAMNWCSENGAELRRRGYRQAQQVALRAAGAVL
jgi:glycosyltransferase involved in cell wall biosynthesis